MHIIHSAAPAHIKLSLADTYSHFAPPNTGVDINVFQEKNMYVHIKRRIGQEQLLSYFLRY